MSCGSAMGTCRRAPGLEAMRMAGQREAAMHEAEQMDRETRDCGAEPRELSG